MSDARARRRDVAALRIPPPEPVIAHHMRSRKPRLAGDGYDPRDRSAWGNYWRSMLARGWL